MDLHISLPSDAEDELRNAFGGTLDQAALEALIIEGYRSGRLSSAQISRILGFDNRWDVQEWLGERGATWNYSLDDLEADRCTIRQAFGDNP